MPKSMRASRSSCVHFGRSAAVASTASLNDAADIGRAHHGVTAIEMGVGIDQHRPHLPAAQIDERPLIGGRRLLPARSRSIRPFPIRMSSSAVAVLAISAARSRADRQRSKAEPARLRCGKTPMSGQTISENCGGIVPCAVRCLAAAISGKRHANHAATGSSRGIALRSSSTTRLGSVSRPPRARTISFSAIGWPIISCSGMMAKLAGLDLLHDIDRIEKRDGLAAARDLLHELDGIGLDGRMQRDIGVREGEIDRRPDGHGVVGNRHGNSAQSASRTERRLASGCLADTTAPRCRSWLATIRMPALEIGL